MEYTQHDADQLNAQLGAGPFSASEVIEAIESVTGVDARARIEQLLQDKRAKGIDMDSKVWTFVQTPVEASAWMAPGISFWISKAPERKGVPAQNEWRFFLSSKGKSVQANWPSFNHSTGF